MKLEVSDRARLSDYPAAEDNFVLAQESNDDDVDDFIVKTGAYEQCLDK